MKTIWVGVLAAVTLLLSLSAWTGCVSGDDCRGCLIDGVCHPAGTPQPGNPCGFCAPTVNDVNWSPAPEDTACDDDGVACTDDVCDGLGACVHSPTPGTCRIDDICYADQDASVANVCMVCDPSKSTTQFVPARDGLLCDDGDVCTGPDTCLTGECTPATIDDCDDGLDCTEDSCDGQGGCVRTVGSGFCAIAGACISDGTVNPSNPCEYCDAASSPEAWSVTVCDDGVACTDDVCTGPGTCDHPVLADKCLVDTQCFDDGQTDGCLVCDPSSAQDALTATPCPVGADLCQPNTCNPDTKACEPGPQVDCSDLDGLCAVGTCDPTDGGCVTVLPSDLGCDDEDACSSGDTCTDVGVCEGTPYTCDPCEACDGTGGCSGFAPDGTTCDDGAYETADDVCDGAGSCAGTTITCGNPPAACVALEPNGTDCTEVVSPSFCYIGGQCYAMGESGPTDPCVVCNGGTEWTLRSDGELCDDGDPCTAGETCTGGLCGGGGLAPCDGYNLAFVTPTAFNEAGLNTSAADSACNVAAEMAGLQPNGAQQFMAWFSDGTSTASERLAATGARGWIRMDGLPVADEANDFSEGRLRYPVVLEPDGSSIGSDAYVLTDTVSGGFANCGPPNRGYGRLDFTNGAFSSVGCQDPFALSPRLLCLQTTQQGTLPSSKPVSELPRLAFLSDPAPQTYLTTFSGPDYWCRDSATSAGLPTADYIALVGVGGQTPNSRLMGIPFDGPLYRPDGVQLTEVASSLLSGAPLLSGISVDASGEPVTSLIAIGAPGLDMAPANNCDNWSMTTGTTLQALGGGSLGDWFTATPDPLTPNLAPCTDPFRFVCVERRRHNRVFLTTTQQPGGGLGGRAGADQLCETQADANFIEGTFVAVLSTSLLPARDHIVAAGGGVEPRGFITLDGRPLANTLDDLLSPTARLWSAPDVEVDGTRLNTDVGGAEVHTGGLLASGTPDDYCGDWDGGTGTTIAGIASATNAAWHSFDPIGSCNKVRRILCVEVGFNNVLNPPEPVTGRAVWVSSSKLVPGVDGVDAAHQLCEDEAGTAGLPSGVYLAGIGTSSSSALNGLDSTGAPWVNPDGVPITASASDLDDTQAPLDSGIVAHADGTLVNTDTNVFTGGNAFTLNAAQADTCNQWTDPTWADAPNQTFPGLTHAAWFTGATWGEASCEAPGASVFCFEKRRHNVAFISQLSITPGALGGVEGADAYCQQRATFGGFEGTYKALLSDGSPDPLARFEGARGFVDVFGNPTADTLQQWLSGKHHRPLRYSEIGAPVSSPKVPLAITWTGAQPDTCGLWTDTSGTFTAAWPDVYDGAWTAAEPGLSCGDDTMHLVCIGTDFANPLPPPQPTNPRLAFLLPDAVLGGGAQSLDAQCADTARASLSLNAAARFKAAVATTSASIQTRLGLSTDHAWARVDGTLLAETTADLVTGNLFTVPLTLDGQGVDQNVWLGAVDFASPAQGVADNCGDWSDTATNGYNIVVKTVMDAWPQAPDATTSCNAPQAVLCLQVN